MSAFHHEAQTKLASLSGQPPVNSQISSQKLKEQKTNRDILMLQLSSLKYLARQGLSIHSHTEEEGNLQQLMKIRLDESGISSTKWFEDGNYMSHDIVNELIQMMANL